MLLIIISSRSAQRRFKWLQSVIKSYLYRNYIYLHGFICTDVLYRLYKGGIINFSVIVNQFFETNVWEIYRFTFRERRSSIVHGPNSNSDASRWTRWFLYRLIHVRFPAKPDVSEPTLKSILIHSLRTNGGLRPQRENRSRSLIFEGDNFSPVAKAAAD